MTETREHAKVRAYRRALILLCEAGHVEPKRVRQALRVARNCTPLPALPEASHD